MVADSMSSGERMHSHRPLSKSRKVIGANAIKRFIIHLGPLHPRPFGASWQRGVGHEFFAPPAFVVSLG